MFIKFFFNQQMGTSWKKSVLLYESNSSGRNNSRLLVKTIEHQ